MSTFFRLCIGVLVVLSFAACSSTEKAGEGDGDENSNGPSISNEGLNQQSGPGLAPGTAKVHIEIRNAEQGDTTQSWQSVIKEILGYGSATPPLSVGTELSIRIGSYFKNVSAEPADVMTQDQVICIIQHQQGVGSSQGGSWSLVDIVDQSKN